MSSAKHRQQQTQVIRWPNAVQGLLLAMALASVVLLGVGSIRAETSSPEREAIDEPAVARALDLFLANRLSEALQALDPETLERSGKANLLAGLIHLYRPRENREKAQVHLERAGSLGINHAYTILGNLALEEGCADCRTQAANWHTRALTNHEDPEARLGRAVAWIEMGKNAAQEELDKLLTAATPPYVRVLAATFAGALRLKEDRDLAKELLTFAASHNSADAQAMLGLLLLNEGRKTEAEIWLNRAVGQQAELAMEWYRAQPVEKQLEILQWSAAYLLDSSKSKDTDFAIATGWCQRSSSIDLLCLSRAAEHHSACIPTQGAIDLLGMEDFEKSPAYTSCRLREQFGNPLPEDPGTWPLLRE